MTIHSWERNKKTGLRAATATASTTGKEDVARNWIPLNKIQEKPHPTGERGMGRCTDPRIPNARHETWREVVLGG
jgi:hypothetical protein